MTGADDQLLCEQILERFHRRVGAGDAHVVIDGRRAEMHEFRRVALILQDRAGNLDREGQPEPAVGCFWLIFTCSLVPKGTVNLALHKKVTSSTPPVERAPSLWASTSLASPAAIRTTGQ